MSRKLRSLSAGCEYGDDLDYQIRNQVLQQIHNQVTAALTTRFVDGVDKKNMSCQNVQHKEQDATSVMGGITLLLCVTVKDVPTRKITDLTMKSLTIVGRK